MHRGTSITWARLADTLDALRRTSERELKGWHLMRDFARDHASDLPRDDWSERVADARDRIYENVSNEMIDGLPAAELPQAVDMLLSQWPADAVAGELWRYFLTAMSSPREATLDQVTLVGLPGRGPPDERRTHLRLQTRRNGSLTHQLEVAKASRQTRIALSNGRSGAPTSPQSSWSLTTSATSWLQ